MKLNIVRWPHQALNSIAQPITEFDDALRATVAAMYTAMASEYGIGLAANQVNILKRIIVTRVPGHPDITLINPKIETVQNRSEINREGCLSFPGLFIPVKRTTGITVSYQDEYGNSQVLQAEGLLSICIQHEIDHLNGIVFTDHGIINT